MLRIILGVLAFFAGMILEEGEGLSVVATVFAPYDFARQLVGERGEVTLLLPPGSEAHSYEPTPKDIIDIQNCDLFIYVGGISDAWVADVLDSVGEGVRTVTLMDCVELLEEEHVEGMELEEEHGHDEGEAEYDEHVWTSPRNAALICEKIAAVDAFLLQCLERLRTGVVKFSCLTDFQCAGTEQQDFLYIVFFHLHICLLKM